MKPETLTHFIARMEGRIFSSGDVVSCCGISRDEVARMLRPYHRAGRIAAVSGGDESIRIWRALPIRSPGGSGAQPGKTDPHNQERAQGVVSRAGPQAGAAYREGRA